MHMDKPNWSSAKNLNLDGAKTLTQNIHDEKKFIALARFNIKPDSGFAVDRLLSQVGRVPWCSRH